MERGQTAQLPMCGVGNCEELGVCSEKRWVNRWEKGGRAGPGLVR